ncbi:MAG: phosphoribosylformylglycinamidine cyclo-ligase [Tissierellia bacterium]|nr:phosphoribosylformylglycinamidine cyclo-ligase [Tissierellia bacterium]
MKIRYQDSGVNISEGNRTVDLIKSVVKSTYDGNVLGDLGLFSGAYALGEAKDMEEPVLLAATDGVGTKLMIGQMMDKHDTVGIDLVAMSVNDLICQGARPLIFLDYIATGKVIPEKMAEIVSGVAEGCRQSGCALIGGETAEMPGMYAEDEYDLAGFAVGLADKKAIIDGSTIVEGDVILGLGSTGLHSNGYSLARKLFLDHLKMDLKEQLKGSEKTLGELLLEPTRIYVKTILDVTSRFDIKGIVNITGGGLIENVPRILPEGLQATIDSKSWDHGELFTAIESFDLIEHEELYRSLNMGIGMALIVSPAEAAQVKKRLEELGEAVYEIGAVEAGDGGSVVR